MSDLSQAISILEHEIEQFAKPATVRVPRATEYVVIEANWTGTAELALALLDILQNWESGGHQHLEYVDSKSNPPLVLMMKDDQ